MSFRTPLLRLVASLNAITFASVADAQSQTYVDLSAAAGYSSNSSLRDSSGAAVFGRASASGVHSIVGPRSATNLSAFVENSTYSGNGGSRQIFNLGASTRYNVSTLVSIFGNISFSGDAGGQLFNRFNDVPLAPTPVPVASLLPDSASLSLVAPLIGVDPLPDLSNDPSVFDFNRRQYRLAGSAGASIKVSPRDSLSVTGGARRVFFSANGDDLDYSTYNANLGWQHQISEQTSAGASVGIQRANYAGPNEYATIISPSVTYRTVIGERWDANISAGVSISNRRSALGRDRSLAPSFNLSLCRSTEAARYCGQVSHSISADAGRTARKSTSLGVDYSNRLSAKDTIQARVRVGRSSGDNSVSDLSRATYYTAGMSYSRRLSDRFSTGVDAGIRKLSGGSQGGTPADLTLSAFVRYRLGDIR